MFIAAKLDPTAMINDTNMPRYWTGAAEAGLCIQVVFFGLARAIQPPVVIDALINASTATGSEARTSAELSPSRRLKSPLI